MMNLLVDNKSKKASIQHLVFNNDNKVTDEALLACQICGVDPSSLI